MITRFLLLASIGACPGASSAQTPFSYGFDPSTPGLTIRALGLDRIGPDAYRVTGTIAGSDTAWFYRAEMDADGALSNMSLTRCDTGFNTSYQSVILNTTDGGQLFGYLYVEGGTDKQTFVKLDADGAVQWARHYPDNYAIFLNDGERGMCEKDGHYFVLGHRQDVPVNIGWGGLMLELDATGACVQTRTWAETDQWSDLGRGILPTADNGLYTVQVQRPYYGSSTFPHVCVQRWDASLQVEWSYQYSLGNYHTQNHVLRTQDDGLLLTGQIRFNSGSGPFRPYFIRLDPSGQVLWARVVLDTQVSPTAVVEEPDGAFTVLLHQNAPTLLVARLDSSGAFVAANAADGLPTSAWPLDIVRDSIAGEHLVRAYVSGVGGSIYLMRLDANAMFACGNQPYAWTDSLVTPQQLEFPITASTSTLASVDTAAFTVPGSFVTADACLSTTLRENAPAARPRAWPVPLEEVLHMEVGTHDRGPVPYEIVDAIGRVELSGSARVGDGGIISLDVHQLGSGAHLVRLWLTDRTARIQVVR